MKANNHSNKPFKNSDNDSKNPQNCESKNNTSPNNSISEVPDYSKERHYEKPTAFRDSDYC